MRHFLKFLQLSIKGLIKDLNLTWAILLLLLKKYAFILQRVFRISLEKIDFDMFASSKYALTKSGIFH